MTKPEGSEEDSLATAPIVEQVLYQNAPRRKNEYKCLSLQEWHAREYSFIWEKARELFEELLEHNILMLPEIKLPDEVG